MSNIIADQVFNTILGYRDTALLNLVASKDSPKKWSEFENFWPSLALELSGMSHYIRYEHFNYLLWLELRRYSNVDDIQSIVKSHSDLPMEDYVLGLRERNELIWEHTDLKKEFRFLDGKTVLDFGYGSGFYSEYFVNLAKKVYGVERKEVYSMLPVLLQTSPRFVNVPEGETIPGLVDAIWLSEVIHGKNPIDNYDIVRRLAGMLQPDGMLIINELKPDTALSKHFNIQMKLHTNGGKLYTMQEVIDMIPFKEIKVLRDYQYHYWIGGTLQC